MWSIFSPIFRVRSDSGFSPCYVSIYSTLNASIFSPT